jgi:GntR family carbon starvation induced transcriptional regulator
MGSEMNEARGLTRATLTGQLENALRTDIIQGVFAPGERLRASELTGRYSVSATPLREALQRLAAQNLVEIDPRLGASVARMSRDDLHDTYWIHQLLEPLALERSMDRGDEAWEGQLQTLFDDFSRLSREQDDGVEQVVAWSQAHRAFHEGLLERCDSAWLQRILRLVRDHSERYRMLSLGTGVRDTVDEHAQILTAVRNHDKEAAVKALRDHLAATVSVLDQILPVSDDHDATPTSSGRGQRRSAITPARRSAR